MSARRTGLVAGFVVAMAQAPTAPAQTPQGTAFTYQGRLTATGAPASGPYDLRLVLFDAPAGGVQVGPTISLEDVPVSEGLFTVSLDFGSVFLGEKRWLELAVRPGASTGAHTVIAPRQELAPSPSALFSHGAADALGLGGVPAGQFVQTNDPRLSDARVPLPGSPDYVRNGTTPQAANFVVTGTGTADILAAITQYNLGAERVLAAPGSNVFAGIGAGQGNTTAFANTFVGFNAGSANTVAPNNAFFGHQAGRSSVSGGGAFFGAGAGAQNTTGGQTFIGHLAGEANTTGPENTFVGSQAGRLSNGGGNSFLGSRVGVHNTTGSFNTFVGQSAGDLNTTGTGNTFIGANTSLDTVGALSSNNTLLGRFAKAGADLSNATALGARAMVTVSNALVLGAVAGVNAGVNTNVAIGTTAPAARLHIVDGGSNVLVGASGSCAGVAGLAFAPSIGPFCQNLALYGGDGSTYINRPAGGTIAFRENSVNQVLIRPGGLLSVSVLGPAGATPLCRNSSSDISTCSSSLRYKDDVASFDGGLEIVDRLRPISFTWKATGQPDIGLAAEEVAEVEPRLAFRNDRGEIEGVNYAQLTAVLVNALRQQEKHLRAEIAELRAVVCELRPQSAACRPRPER